MKLKMLLPSVVTTILFLFLSSGCFSKQEDSMTNTALRTILQNDNRRLQSSLLGVPEGRKHWRNDEKFSQNRFFGDIVDIKETLYETDDYSDDMYLDDTIEMDRGAIRSSKFKKRKMNRKNVLICKTTHDNKTICKKSTWQSKKGKGKGKSKSKWSSKEYGKGKGTGHKMKGKGKGKGHRMKGKGKGKGHWTGKGNIMWIGKGKGKGHVIFRPTSMPIRTLTPAFNPEGTEAPTPQTGTTNPTVTRSPSTSTRTPTGTNTNSPSFPNSLLPSTSTPPAVPTVPSIPSVVPTTTAIPTATIQPQGSRIPMSNTSVAPSRQPSNSDSSIVPVQGPTQGTATPSIVPVVGPASGSITPTASTTPVLISSAPSIVPVASPSVATISPTTILSTIPSSIPVPGPTTPPTTAAGSATPSSVPVSGPTQNSATPTGITSITPSETADIPTNTPNQNLQTQIPTATGATLVQTKHALLYNITGEPSEVQLAEAQNVTMTYLEGYLRQNFELNTLANLDDFNGIVDGSEPNNSTIFYDVAVSFGPGSQAVPTQSDLDVLIQSSYLPPAVDALITSLQALDPSNPFSTTTSVNYNTSTTRSGVFLKSKKSNELNTLLAIRYDFRDGTLSQRERDDAQDVTLEYLQLFIKEKFLSTFDTIIVGFRWLETGVSDNTFELTYNVTVILSETTKNPPSIEDFNALLKEAFKEPYVDALVNALKAIPSTKALESRANILPPQIDIKSMSSSVTRFVFIFTTLFIVGVILLLIARRKRRINNKPEGGSNKALLAPIRFS
jgi:hypothetical protein